MIKKMDGKCAIVQCEPVNHPTVGCQLSDPGPRAPLISSDRLHRNCGGAVAEYGSNLHGYII